MNLRLQLFVIVILTCALGLGTLSHRPATASEMTATSSRVVQPSVVVLWNEAMLAAVRNGAPRPTVTARSLFLVHQAMYDAWALYDTEAAPTVLSPALRRPAQERSNANKVAAVSQAAYHVLVNLYPEYESKTQAFSRLLHLLGYEPVWTGEAAPPAGIGYLAAHSVLSARAHDGSNAANNYADITSALYPDLYEPVNSSVPAAPNALGNASFDPNRWEPLRVPSGALKDAKGQPIMDPSDPASYTDQRFLTPHWGSVRPFALTSGNQFRPPAPPQSGSSDPYRDGLGRTMTHDQAYRQQVEEVLELSATLTDEQKVIAEYWADGPRSETPPGHWNALAHGISARDQHTLGEDVQLYFALNGALFDASIAAWDAKRVYDYIRPVSAIRDQYAGQLIRAWGGPDEGARLIPAERWRPYQDLAFVTPAFAEYVSGHSTFSAAAAEVLTAFTGSNRFYDGETVLYHEDFNRDGVPDLLGQYLAPVKSNRFESGPYEIVVLQWATFQEAADEAGRSRLYGGIHFQDGDLRGRELGRAVGAQAYEGARDYWTGSARLTRPR